MENWYITTASWVVFTNHVPSTSFDFSMIPKLLTPNFLMSWTARPRPDMPAPTRTSVSKDTVVDSV